MYYAAATRAICFPMFKLYPKVTNGFRLACLFASQDIGRGAHQAAGLHCNSSSDTHNF